MDESKRVPLKYVVIGCIVALLSYFYVQNDKDNEYDRGYYAGYNDGYLEAEEYIKSETDFDVSSEDNNDEFDYTDDELEDIDTKMLNAQVEMLYILMEYYPEWESGAMFKSCGSFYEVMGTMLRGITDPNDKNFKTVYLNVGEKYFHTYYCDDLNDPRNSTSTRVLFAIENGYQECPKCHPTTY